MWWGFIFCLFSSKTVDIGHLLNLLPVSLTGSIFIIDWWTKTSHCLVFEKQMSSKGGATDHWFGSAVVDAVFEYLLLRCSLSRTRFGSSSGETAGSGGCWWSPNTQREDQALRLQQPSGLWVPLLLPPRYNLGQYAQVSMRIQQQTRLETHMQHTLCYDFFVLCIVVGLIKNTTQKSACRINTCCCYHCIIKEAVVPSVSKSKVCGMFMLMTLPYTVRKQFMVSATLCPDGKGPLSAAHVPTLMIKPVATSAIIGESGPNHPKGALIFKPRYVFLILMS